MGLRDIFRKREQLVGIDIGATGIKLVELDLRGAMPRLVNVAMAPLSGDLFSNYAITRLDRVGEQLTQLLAAQGVSDRRVVTAVPGPSVFTKKIAVPRLKPAELAAHVQLEAGNFVPHKIDAVKLDYQVLGPRGKQELEVLVAAVKNEIIESYVDALGLAGLEAAVVDVDAFALQNVFELGYPEYRERTVALVNVGARYSCISICAQGRSLLIGDIPAAGRSITEALAAGLGVTFDVAEDLKRQRGGASPAATYGEVCARAVESVAAELNRQLTFLWSASGTGQPIDAVFITGGGADVPGFIESVTKKTGLPCAPLDPVRGIDVSSGCDPAIVGGLQSRIAIAVGLALREPGDRSVEYGVAA